MTPIRFLLLVIALLAGTPVAATPTLLDGAEALDASLLSARFRTLGATSNGAQRIFVGLADLGAASVGGIPNRAEAGANWGPLSASSTLEFELDRAGNRLVARVANATGSGGANATYAATYTDLANRLVAIKGTAYSLDDINVLRIAIRREAGASLRLDDVRINDAPVPGFVLLAAATGAAANSEWSMVDICLGAGNGFRFRAALTRTGTLSGSQEANKIDLVAGVSRARGLRCVNPADLAITAAAFTPPTLAAGQSAQLAISARNNGPGALGTGDQARVSLTLPAALSYVANDGGCDVSGLPTLICPLATLLPGAAKTVRITVATAADAASQSVSVTTSARSTVFDSVPSNNAQAASLTINAAPPPSAIAMTRLDPSPTNLQSVRWAVSFDRAVQGVGAGDFELVAAGTVAGATISSVTGTAGSYVVSVARGTGSGTLRLDLVDDDSIVDDNGTPLGGIGPGNGNFAGETYAIDASAPAIAGLVAIGAPDAGEFVAGATLDGAITRLLLRWSKPMETTAASDASRFVLLDAGADDVFSTSACSGVLGDDVAIPLAAAYLGSETSTVLVPAVPAGLRPGAYRLVVCAGLADMVGNLLPPVPPIDFGVAFDNALLNPNFDESTADFEFTAAGGGASGFALLADDSQGTLASRALEITTAEGTGIYTVSQCVPAPLIGTFGAGLRARITGNATVSLEVELRRLPDCLGPLLRRESITVGGGTPGGNWVRADAVPGAALPVGVYSARITVRASLAATDARVAIDTLYFDRRGTLAEPDELFSNSFED
jgi:hypothetical protein